MQQLTSSQSLVDIGMKFFHARTIAAAASKLLATTNNSLVDSDDVEDEKAGEEDLQQELPQTAIFRPPSWKFIAVECAQFVAFNRKTGEGRRNFIKARKKPYT